LEEIPLDVRQRMRFQHDGAPAHHYRVRRFLIRRYQNRQIICDGPYRGLQDLLISTLLILIFGDIRKTLSSRLLQQLGMI